MISADLLEFLENERVCVFAVQMENGSPHAATVHFAYTPNPMGFVIQTSPSSRKAECFRLKEEAQVSLVVGFVEPPDGSDRTFQLNGKARIVNPHGELANLYLDKFHEKKGKWPSDIFLSIEPSWWRFSDWTNSGGKPRIESSQIS